MEANPSTTASVGLSRRVLRFADGASRPVLPEEIYVDYQLDTQYAMSFASTRSRVFGWWPEQGRAWELLGDVITEHLKSGTLVMCLNTDPDDHPHHHITQDVTDQFRWGKPPLVLRYLTTPIHEESGQDLQHLRNERSPFRLLTPRPDRDGENSGGIPRLAG